MKIIVDVDATPKRALAICRKAQRNLTLTWLLSPALTTRIESDQHIVTGDAPQETDLQVLNLATAGDLVVTQDWGLAAIVLGNGAAALSPTGRVFREENH